MNVIETIRKIVERLISQNLWFSTLSMLKYNHKRESRFKDGGSSLGIL